MADPFRLGNETPPFAPERRPPDRLNLPVPYPVTRLSPEYMEYVDAVARWVAGERVTFARQAKANFGPDRVGALDRRFRDCLPVRNPDEPLLAYLGRVQQYTVDQAVQEEVARSPNLTLTATERGWIVTDEGTGLRIEVVTTLKEAPYGQ